jgi:hypothetical protein
MSIFAFGSDRKISLVPENNLSISSSNKNFKDIYKYLTHFIFFICKRPGSDRKISLVPENNLSCRKVIQKLKLYYVECEIKIK